MKRILVLALALGSALPALTLAQEELPAGVEGLWLSEDGGMAVKIEECDNSVCGRVFWVKEGAQRLDEHSPDESRRTLPLCGLKIMWDYQQEGPGVWNDGKFYDVKDGSVSESSLEVAVDDTLEIRSYSGLALFGSSRTWQRVEEAEYTPCDIPDLPSLQNLQE